MKFPIIGLTTSRSQSASERSQISLPEAYVQAITRVGATPLLIPLGLTDIQLIAILCRLDGLLLTGGGDVQPSQYGGNDHPLVSSVDPDRDRVEIYLIREAIQKGVPFLGICRGIQVLNIALGGNIYEDIQDQRPDAIRHDYSEGHGRDYLAHDVYIKPNSRLAQLIGRTRAPVNSFHHQGIKYLAPDLKVGAEAPDGLIEAVELANYPFGIAVQWHPECMTGVSAMDELFLAFVSTPKV